MILGNGIDIVSVPRFEKTVNRSGKAFLDKIFNSVELESVKEGKMYYQRLAARFAAKEAVVKAIGKECQLFLKDIIITKHESGAPLCDVPKLPEIEFLVSLSHIEEYAVATAIAQKKI